ncbi:6-bladed beta-propeller, partial [Bacteroides fragilis]
YMLSPFGSLYVYSLDGKFIKEIKLPTRANYQLIEELESKYFVTWTLPASENDNCISVISKESSKNVKEFWHVPPVLTTLNSKPFYNYEHKIYFSNPYQNEVYEVRTDSLRVAYRWDFGKDNLDLKEYGFTLLEDKKVEEYKLMLQYLRDSTVPYFLCDQYQNDKFYYIMLVFGLKHSKNLFYRKEDGKSFFFEKTTEGIHFEPLAFNEDFLTCIVFNEDFPNYEKVLPPEEYKKLEERLEDDNPCLIKFYFK